MSMLSAGVAAEIDRPLTEARFDPDFDRQANEELFGTTAEVVTAGRERFRYWTFQLLFLLCSDLEQGKTPISSSLSILPLGLQD